MLILTQKNDSTNVETKLDAIGIPFDIIKQIVMRGHFARSTATESHPNNSGGTFQWHEMIRSKRDLLKPLGWVKQDNNNKALTVNPTRTIALDISGGTKETGRAGSSPQTRNPKGEQTEKLVNFNHQQMQLFELNPVNNDTNTIDEYQTWILLYCFEVIHGQREIRFELSLPTMMENGRITGWNERIIFEPIYPDSFLDYSITSTEPDPSEGKNKFSSDIDLEISIKNEPTI